MTDDLWPYIFHFFHFVYFFNFFNVFFFFYFIFISSISPISSISSIFLFLFLSSVSSMFSMFSISSISSLQHESDRWLHWAPGLPDHGEGPDLHIQGSGPNEQEERDGWGPCWEDAISEVGRKFLKIFPGWRSLWLSFNNNRERVEYRQVEPKGVGGEEEEEL